MRSTRRRCLNHVYAFLLQFDAIESIAFGCVGNCRRCERMSANRLWMSPTTRRTTVSSICNLYYYTHINRDMFSCKLDAAANGVEREREKDIACTRYMCRDLLHHMNANWVKFIQYLETCVPRSVYICIDCICTIFSIDIYNSLNVWRSLRRFFYQRVKLETLSLPLTRAIYLFIYSEYAMHTELIRFDFVFSSFLLSRIRPNNTANKVINKDFLKSHDKQKHIEARLVTRLCEWCAETKMQICLLF